MTEVGSRAHAVPSQELSAEGFVALELLRFRLTRRGVALSTGLLRPRSPPGGISGVPASLVGSTVTAANSVSDGQRLARRDGLGIGGARGSGVEGATHGQTEGTCGLGIASSVLVTFRVVIVIRTIRYRAIDRSDPAGRLHRTDRTDPWHGRWLSGGEHVSSDLRGIRPDGITFERILTGGVKQPLFLDIDTGRFMTPPFGFLIQIQAGPCSCRI